MDQPGLKTGKDDVGDERLLGDTEDEGGDQNQSSQRQRFQDVQARPGKPIHVLDRMMNGVDRPQPFHLVKGAVDGVLDEVGDDDRHHELNGPRKRRHERLNVVVHRPGENVDAVIVATKAKTPISR